MTSIRRLRRVARLASSLRRDRRAATAVELALISPFFILIVMMIIENGLMLFAQAVLENATFEAARQIQIGNITNQSDFQKAVCSYTSSTFFNCNALNVYVTSVSSSSAAFPTAVRPNPNGTFPTASFNSGSNGDFVLAEVAYNRAYVTPWLVRLGTGWVLLSTAAFQNEPSW